MKQWSGVMKKEGSENNMNWHDVMTAGEVASFLKVSVGAVRRWTRDGKLKGYRMGGQGDWRYLKRDVMDFLCGSDG